MSGKRYFPGLNAYTAYIKLRKVYTMRKPYALAIKWTETMRMPVLVYPDARMEERLKREPFVSITPLFARKNKAESSRWNSVGPIMKRVNSFASYLLAAVVCLYDPDTADRVMLDVLEDQYYEEMP